MRKISIRKKLFLLIILGTFIVVPNVLASETKLEVDWPPSPGMGTTLSSDSTITDFVKYFYEWGIVLGGLAAFIALLIAGFLYLTSIGDPARMKEAKDRILAAIGGLILLLGSWLILNTLNTQLTKLEIPNFGREFNESVAEEMEKMMEEMEERERIATLPCDFIYFYPEEGYKGAAVKKEEEGIKNFGKWKSVRLIRKLDNEEKEDIEKEIKDSGVSLEEKLEEKLEERYSFYEKKNGDYYVQGGMCKITFYTKTGTWWQPWTWGKEEEISSLYGSTGDITASVGGENRYKIIDEYQLEKIKI